MTDRTKTIARMNDELWQSYDLFRDPLLRRADPALITATVNDQFQLYCALCGADPAETANPQLLAMMGDELAQAYEFFKDPIRRAGDPVLVLDVMKDLDDIARRMKPGQGLDLDPVHVRDLGFPPDRDDDNPDGAEPQPRG
jgi:hypothetical protein